MPSDLARDLARAVEGEVRFDPVSRALYSTDASHYQLEPLGVVLPRSVADIRAVLEIAARYDAPVLPRGGGSSLAGQAVGRAVVLDFSKYMRGLLEVHVEEQYARVQPGLVCDALNSALRPHGLMFPTEPASSNRATLGGIVGNNATGAHSVMYGMTIDHLISARALLADGSEHRFAEASPQALASAGSGLAGLASQVAALVSRYEPHIRERFPKTWRRASGYALNYLLPHHQTASQPANWYLRERPAPQNAYPPVAGFNLARILAGSEGTLAVLTEATLNLVPRPKHTALCIVHFESLAAAADATPTILECRPSAVELIDRMLIDLTRTAPGFAARLTFIEGRPEAVLVVEFYGDDEAHLASQIGQLENHLRARGLAQVFVRATTARQQADVWGIRKVGLGLLASMRSAAKPTAFMEDVAVPVEHLGNWVRATERLFAEFGVDSGYYAHASAGCLHIRPVLNLRRPADVDKMRRMSAAVLEIVVQMGGALSGEHGDGLSRSAWNGRLFGPEVYAAFCELKRLFDPHNRLNPGKIVDAPALDQYLRYGPQFQPLNLATDLSFAEYAGGLGAAVEQCNGMGVCRKADGVMCPSFHATSEEEHSTRGRANALRAALTGRLPLAALASPRMHAVMDLCLECKACKRECPSGVDMAKIKYEWLARYQARRGVPVRSRLFAHIHTISRLACLAAPLANRALAASAGRWFNATLFRIAVQRRLPEFAAPTFRHWHQEHRPPLAPEAGAPPSVVLFVDTFTNFNHPEIGRAAVSLLEAAGYGVLLAQHGCCGRPMISKGMLPEARAAASGMVKALRPYVDQGLPIVGLEPSCLLTFRDEYLDLLPRDAGARTLATQAVMIEEFVASQADRFARRAPFTGPQPGVLLHPHCYQKSLTGTAALHKMLSLPGWKVAEIDAGCCGMAGSFGYEAEHYEISLRIGEDRLFPAVRAAAPSEVVVAPGMSCRHQIEHGTGRRPLHPVELLAGGLGSLVEEE